MQLFHNTLFSQIDQTSCEPGLWVSTHDTVFLFPIG